MNILNNDIARVHRFRNLVHPAVTIALCLAIAGLYAQRERDEMHAMGTSHSPAVVSSGGQVRALPLGDGIAIGSGNSGFLLDVQGAASQISIDSANTQYQLTASDTILDINTGGSNAPTTGAQIIRVGRHTSIGDYGSGGDTQIESTFGNSSTVVWQLSAQNYAELGRGWGLGPTWAMLTGSVAASAGSPGVTSQPMIGLIGASSSTSTTLTFVYSDVDPAFRTTPTAIHCFATPDGTTAAKFIQVTGSTKVTSPPGGTVTFSCVDTTNAATTCPAFFYTCWGAS